MSAEQIKNALEQVGHSFHIEDVPREYQVIVLVPSSDCSSWMGQQQACPR